MRQRPTGVANTAAASGKGGDEDAEHRSLHKRARYAQQVRVVLGRASAHRGG